jgi:hypothetical protein
MSTLIFDLEANGFVRDATKIHCAGHSVDNGTGFSKPVVTRNEKSFFNSLDLAETVVGHNITGYDIPLINKLYPGRIDWTKKNIFDTFLGSCLLRPDNTWGHTIEAWGEHLGYPKQKVDITDWTEYTDLMGERCAVDVGINVEVYREQKNSWLTNEPQVMLLETIVAMIHARQEMWGVWFDEDKARELLELFQEKVEAIRVAVAGGIPAKIEQAGKSVDSPFTKAGGLAARVVNHFGEGDPVLDTIEGPFSKLIYKPFNLDSHKQVKDYLLTVGWKPTEWNFNASGRTSPKLTEDSYDSLPEGLGKQIADYYVLNHRRRYIHNEKKNGVVKGAVATVRNDHRVPAKAMTCATPTSRYRHMETVCNIPKPSKPYGKDIRSLLGVKPGHLQIGIDLSGIEARMMCHYALPYPGGQELMELVLNGDYHQYNADMWSCTRDDAKNGLYALMYGCGEAKLASQLNKPKGSGGKWFDRFWAGNPALKSLIDDVNGVYDSGRPLMGIDRRRYSVRQKRMALNTLFQGGAAIVFKHWMRLCDEWVQDYNAKLPNCQVHQMIAYHDELQFELCSDDPKLAEEVANELSNLAIKAGEILKIKVPIEAEYKIGKNWAECH